MVEWNVQFQDRRANHAVTKVYGRQKVGPDISNLIGVLIADGWWIARNDAISVTMRSPEQPDGSYSYAHFWMEGYPFGSF